MKVTPIALKPPHGAEDHLSASPEILAAACARYSRSNDGIRNIFDSIDWSNEQKSVDSIFKFVDYGHASIAGLTGTIAIAFDDVSMFAAAKMFEISPCANGQESSTRYISMTGEVEPDWVNDYDIPEELCDKMSSFWKHSYASYLFEYERLTNIIEENPEIIKYPENANSKMKERLYKNFALDRARYFLPYATKTNIVLSQTARDWAHLASAFLSSGLKELNDIAEEIKKVLSVYSPNLLRHARQKPGWISDWAQNAIDAADQLTNIHDVDDNVYIQFNTINGHSPNAIEFRENRYDRSLWPARTASLTVGWENMAIAEIRDLNRHRPGGKYIVYTHSGFYSPDIIDLNAHAHSIKVHDDLLIKFNDDSDNWPLIPYALRLGSQSRYFHTMPFDNFVYMAELRTGPGAHFRYAEHIRDAMVKLEKTYPEFDFSGINLGEAEPE